MSTQILTKKINLENKLEKHISIKDKISQIFPDTKVHATSVDYDEKFRYSFVNHKGKKN